MNLPASVWLVRISGPAWLTGYTHPPISKEFAVVLCTSSVVSNFPCIPPPSPFADTSAFMLRFRRRSWSERRLRHRFCRSPCMRLQRAFVQPKPRSSIPVLQTISRHNPCSEFAEGASSGALATGFGGGNVTQQCRFWPRKLVLDRLSAEKCRKDVPGASAGRIYLIPRASSINTPCRINYYPCRIN